jgi:hypothetical protein
MKKVPSKVIQAGRAECGIIQGIQSKDRPQVIGMHTTQSFKVQYTLQFSRGFFAGEIICHEFIVRAGIELLVK